MNGKPLKSPPIAVYWILKHKVLEFQPLITKLFACGALKATSTSESLMKMKVSELQEILDDYALPRSGSKQELVQRVWENIPANVVDDIYQKSARFQLTNKGRQIVAENARLIFCVKKCKIGFMRIDDIAAFVDDYPYLSGEEMLLEIENFSHAIHRIASDIPDEEFDNITSVRRKYYEKRVM